MSKFKKTVVFDFDGVVHSYISGWQGPTTISDEPVNGIDEVIQDLRKDFKVVIVSTRCFSEGGVDAIKQWLDKHNIKVDDVLAEKPPAVVYIDDRAICFDGTTNNLANQVRNFKNWLEKLKEDIVDCKHELRCEMNGRCCHKCRRNPKAVLEDYFSDRGYIPVCEHGYNDCIHDPAYILADYYNNVSWVKKRYTLEELKETVKKGCQCEDGCEYDDEDK